MNNIVVYRLYQHFCKKGFNCLRINFRGVGRSEGAPSKGEGELSDATSALDWLHSHYPNATQCWVVGYSFGAWVGMQLLMRRPEVNCFVSVAPPVNTLDFGFLAPCPNSGLIVHAERDTEVTSESVKMLVAKLRNQRRISIEYETIPEADHFFSKGLEELESVIDQYIDKRLSPKAHSGKRKKNLVRNAYGRSDRAV